MSVRYEWRKLQHVTSTEWGILIWLAVGAGIAGGVFIIARSAVQIGSVAYRAMEKQLSSRAATRQAALLSLAMVAGLVVTALIAGYAIFAIFGQLLESTGSINRLNNGS
jgi:F0F1-type ATP synthase assembly protein I